MNQVWLQEKVYKGEIMLKEAGTMEQIADALAKAVSRETLEFHVAQTSAECQRDRHRIALEVAEDKNDDMQDYEENYFE